MTEWYVLLAIMIVMHVVCDFHMQGRMADMKQAAWWEAQTDDPRYKHDWVPVMLLHGFEWAVLVSLPCMLALGQVPVAFMMMVVLQALIHSLVDNLKANGLVINLIQDQAVHMIQIVAILAAYVVVA